MHKKLFIPGPTEVMHDVLLSQADQLIGHRTPEFSELFEEVVEKLQEALYTKNKMFISTSSSTGLMEAAVINCVDKKVLSCVNGAFSKRWREIAQLNGKDTGTVEVEWGQGIKPEMIDEELSKGGYDAITLAHNETSTGVISPLEEIADVMKKYPDVTFLVDAVSSMMGTKIEVDKLGVDLILAGVQKAWALPPGLAVAAVSDKAIEKAEGIENKGYYFNFDVCFGKYWAKKQTISTPIISLIYALNYQLDKILKEEGLENRFQRHTEMAEYVRSWAKEYFDLFAEEGYRSPTVSCIKNTRGFSVADLNKELRSRGMMLSNGYGSLKEKTFRIGHMGDHQLGDVKALIANIEDILEL